MHYIGMYLVLGPFVFFGKRETFEDGSSLNYYYETKLKRTSVTLQGYVTQKNVFLQKRSVVLGV